MLDYDRIIGSIYDCAADPSLWPKTLTEIRDSFQAAYTLIGFANLNATNSEFLPIRYNSPWDENWLNRLGQFLPKIPEVSTMVDGDLDNAWSQLTQSSEAEFHTSEFYEQWVKPQKLRDALNLMYIKRPRYTGAFSIVSANSREPFTPDELRRAAILSPHIRRAILINEMTEKDKFAIALYRKALDSLSVAVFVLGAGRRIIFANTSADRLISDTNFVCLTNSALSACRNGQNTSAFEDALERALRGDQAIGIAGIGVPLFSVEGERAAAYVLPLAGKDIRNSFGAGQCMVFIGRRSEQQPMALEMLRTIFDLTAAEARVAVFIAQGIGPAAISQSLNISIHTVRSHLQHTFAKTNTADQTALGALLNALLPPVTPQGANAR